jgi:DNA-binding PadR family transcriptional regulator
MIVAYWDGLAPKDRISTPSSTGVDTSRIPDILRVVSIRHALLALLNDGPKYGLQLRQEFEARTGEVWPLNVGQVYTTLQRLERDGMVAALSDGDDGPQKSYEITEGGHDELLAWLQTPPEVGQPPRDELLIKVLVAVGVRGVDVHDVVQVHRRHLLQLMQRYTVVKAEASADDVALALIVDAELFRIEAAVRWLDSAEVRLRQGLPNVGPDRGPTNTLLEAARRSGAAKAGRSS